MSFANVSDEERRRYLDLLQEQTTKMMIPAMIYLIIVAVVGLFGNSLVLVVYSKSFKQTSTRIFIMTIAVFDLLTNVLAIPGEIYDMFHRWDFDQPHLCRSRLAVNAFTIITSELILIAVAVTRYRQVCRIGDKQTTIKCAKITSVAVTALAIVCAAPAAILNGRQTKKTERPDIKGDACTIDDRYVHTIWPRLYIGIVIVGFVICSTSLIVLYIRIGVTAWRHRRINGVTSKYRSKASSFSTAGKTTSESSRSETDTEKDDSLKKGVGEKLLSFFRGKHHKNGSTWVKYIETEMEFCSDQRNKTTSDNKSIGLNKAVNIQKTDGNKGIDCSNEAESLNAGPKPRDCMPGVIETDTTDQNELTTNIHDQQAGTEDLAIRPCSNYDGQDKDDPSCTTPDRGELESDVNLSSEEHSQLYTHCPVNCMPDTNLSLKCTTEVLPPNDEGQQLNAANNRPEFEISNNNVNNRLPVDFSLCENTEIYKNSNKEYLSKSTQNKSKPVKGYTKDQKTAKNRRPMTRTTIMLIAISAVYVIGFAVPLSIILFRYSTPHVFGDMTFSGFCAYNLFLRFHFLNSASNAIIYSICDKKFRERAWKILKCFV